MLADAAAMAVQYGRKNVVCDHMVQAVEQKRSLPEEFAKFVIDMYGADFGRGCFYDTECLKNDPSRWSDVRSWRWQKCSQLAYFQVAPKSDSLRAKIVTIEYHEEQCREVFGDAVNPKRGVKEIIKLYGGLHPPTHKVFFANGADDPWQRASIVKSISEDLPANLAKCDLCGHCGDLGGSPNDPEPLKKQRVEIERYLTRWLNVTAREDSVPSNEMDTIKSNAIEARETTQMEAQTQTKEVYRSSPLVLVPVFAAFLVLVGAVHFDLLNDSPAAHRGAYVRLDATS
ncbi:hypothetical protein PINS_up005664 [Pythium insidiosum]|nr:hypothetical protein PINS_up005664 [Pythium insidiosum]